MIRHHTARLQVDVRFLFPVTSRLAHMTLSHRLLDAADAAYRDRPEINCHILHPKFYQ